ncbi:MAG: cupin domain-containing protein [Candidatus Dadabacteria bacterium]|nr:MAG: cupin domain-containing protein [Candidatus Dadabacteria bacterium]
MTLEKWDSSYGQLSEKNMRQLLEKRGYTTACYTYPPGTYFPDHTHRKEKIDGVISGKFRIKMGGNTYDLGPGDMIRVPAGSVHSAEVIGEEPVISVDAVKR